MPVFLFKGRILPEVPELNMWNVPTVHYTEAAHDDLPEGMMGEFHIAINHSMVDLICIVKQNSVSISRVHNRAIAYLRAFVDLNCFATGAPLSVILDTVVSPDGEEQSLRPIHPLLPGLCTIAVNGPNGGIGLDVLDEITKEPMLFLALRDLISALGSADLAVVDCARAIEGLRNLMVPDEEDRKKSWGIFQANLNIDRAYREYVTNLSVGPRHGDRKQWINGGEIDEILQRSWKIMDRFFHFVRRGKIPLAAPEFGLLVG